MRVILILHLSVLMLVPASRLFGQLSQHSIDHDAWYVDASDSFSNRGPMDHEAGEKPLLNVWGLDVLISEDGFGLGTFYQREFHPDWHGFATFSISESKDEREVERYDPFTQRTYVPDKLNRFLVMPLMVGIQHRLFREEIMETFRPYINAGVGPAMIFASPAAEVIFHSADFIEHRQVEFFRSLGRGKAHYTAGGFIGVGANFGSERSNLMGVNFRYYFTYLFGDGLPSLYSISNRQLLISGRKKSFGGFFITLNLGMAY